MMFCCANCLYDVLSSIHAILAQPWPRAVCLVCSQNAASTSRNKLLRAMKRALSEPDSLQVQKQLPTLSALGRATKQTLHSSKVPESLQINIVKLSKALSAPDRIFARADSPNYSFDKRVSFVHVCRFSMPWALRLSPGITPDTRGIFFAALWCHPFPVGLLPQLV